MKRFFTDMNATLRGFLIIALIAAVVVVLSLQSVLATVGGLLQIAFFLAIAFFLFLLWREKRGDIESWQDRSRNVFYAAIVLAVVDIGAFIGLGAVRARRARILPRARRLRLRRLPRLAQRAHVRLGLDDGDLAADGVRDPGRAVE